MNKTIERNIAQVQTTNYLFSDKHFDMEDVTREKDSPDRFFSETDVRIDIITLFKGFYNLQMLEATATTDEFLGSHIRWREDFNHFRLWFYKAFAQMIYDYSVLSCFGELRHTNSQCEETIATEYFWNNARNSRDSFVRNQNIPYSAKSIIHISDILFNHYEWNSGYGGEAWGKIALAQNLYIKGQEAVYIDHCVDLAHNNGSYFDKGMIFYLNEDRGSLMNYLDFKYTAKPEELFMTCPIREIQELIIRANMLGIIPTLSKYFHFKNSTHVLNMYSPCNNLHIFFPKPQNVRMHSDLGTIDIVKLYNPYKFGRELLTRKDITESSEFKNEEEYYRERRRDA